MSFLGRTPSNAPLTTADIPDGIIVAADLAPNSVDSSELVDGSIDTSHLSSSLTLTTPNLGTPSAITLTNATFPAGTIQFIDTVEVRSVGQGTSTGWEDTGMSLTIPSATVALYSKLIIDVRNNIRINGSGTHCFAYWAVMRDQPSGDVWFKVHRYGHHADDGHDVFSSFGGRFVDESLGTGDHRYKTQYKLVSTGYAVDVYPLGEDDESAGKNSITICGVI